MRLSTYTKEVKRMNYTDTFQNFKQELSERLQLAQQVGLSDKEIREKASQLGDWLSQNVEPQSPEQRLLKELWTVSNENEQQTLANALVKLVRN
mgnify:CR=1 FL=1